MAHTSIRLDRNTTVCGILQEVAIISIAGKGKDLTVRVRRLGFTLRIRVG